MLTSTDIIPFVNDPNSIQRYILNWTQAANNGTIDIVDPSNPFTMLLEATAAVSSATQISSINNIRKKHASLGTTRDELYPHLNDTVISNMFATPSEANIIFKINVQELQQTGYRPTDATYVEMTLPKYTEVMVAETYFTLLNNIVIRLYDNNTVFVEQQTDTSSIAINSLGILDGYIVTDGAGNPTIIFETVLKQVKRIAANDTVTAGESYIRTVNIADQFYYANVSYNNANTNGNYISLNTVYDDSYIDPNNPSVYVIQGDGFITIKVPDVYTVDGTVSGNTLVEVYYTQGNIYLPINNYSVTDFTVTKGNTGANASTAVAANITVLASSRDVVNGGLNSLTTDEMKAAIINNSTNLLEVPITEQSLKKNASFNNYEIFKALDVITNRLYIASRNTPVVDSILINARADVYTNTVQAKLSDLVNNSNIYISNDIFVIKSNTVFKEINNIVTIVDDAEMNTIKAMSNSDKIDYFKNSKYFYTPYYYVVDKTDTMVNSRVYDLDSPIINSIKIIGKNTNVVPRVNINQYLIQKTSVGYKFGFTLSTNTDFDNLDPTMIRGMLALPLVNSAEYSYYETTYDPVNKYMYFNILTNDYIDPDNGITITNGDSVITDLIIALQNDVLVYIYTIDDKVTDSTKYFYSEIFYNTKYNNVTVFSKEQLNITFGNFIQYIWDKLHNTYSERMYKRYSDDVLDYYSEDVYGTDPKTGSIFTTTRDTNGVVSLTYIKTHSKGDPKLDSNGNQLYVHRKGDVILDANDNPIVDQYNGVIRYIDILMYEYEYILATSNAYISYVQLLYDNINTWLLTQLPDLNNITLENTDILFKSYKTTLPVKVMVGNVINTIPYTVSPVVTIYVTKNNYSNVELQLITNKIGAIIHSALDTTNISLSDIKSNIITVDSNIIGVKITGLDGSNNLEIFNIYDKTVRLAINKVLALDNNNDLIVNYDITLNVQQI